MKIFFTVSKSGLPELTANCNLIKKELTNRGVKVIATFDKSYWKGTPWEKVTSHLSISEDKYRYVHDSAVRRAIFRADAVVIEASHSSFRLGFEAFFALSQQKPVLVLSQFKNYNHLIDQPNLFGAKYTPFTLPDEIEKFLRHVRKNKLRNRFNLFISDYQRKHIEEAAKHYGVSKSDYLRKLIETDEKEWKDR
jgi:hypothetical protein